MAKQLLIPWIQSSPLGRMLLLAREGGALLLCTWPDAEASPDPLAHCAAAIAAEVAPLVELCRDENEKLLVDTLPKSAAAVAEQLDDYLQQRTTQLELAIDLSLVRSQFRREVLQERPAPGLGVRQRR